MQLNTIGSYIGEQNNFFSIYRAILPYTTVGLVERQLG
jgi:hypothetical protein